MSSLPPKVTVGEVVVCCDGHEVGRVLETLSLAHSIMAEAVALTVGPVAESDPGRTVCAACRNPVEGAPRRPLVGAHQARMGVVTPGAPLPTLTGAQVRAARALLGWASPMLAKRARVSFDKVLKAQDDDGVRSLNGLDLRAVRSTMEAAGIEFDADGSVQRGSPP